MTLTYIHYRNMTYRHTNYVFSEWPKLANATKEQREEFNLSYSGIHWPQIDEDLNFEARFNSKYLCPITDGEDSFLFFLT